MQTNSPEGSISEDSSKSIKTDYKAKVTELLNKTDISENEIKKLSSALRDEPKFEFEVGDKILTENSFEIMSKDKSNPIFILNLLNIINIINLVWNCTKKNIKMFHEILFNLNIMFSYVKNEEQIEYVLLSSIPMNYYELIAKHGRKMFKNDYKLDTNYLTADRNFSQIGLAYQENTIANLSSLLNKKQKETPTIMYYMNHDECIKLFKQQIFNQPTNFPELGYTQGEHFGYNEIDYSFYLEENIEISQDYIMNMAIQKGISKQYGDFSQEKIKFPNNTNIFIEAKTKIENNSQILDKLKKSAEIFAEAYNNPAFGEIKNKFKKENFEYYLFYNHSREDAFKYLKGNSQKDTYDEAQVIFNSGYVQISSIVSLQNQIRTINNNMDELKQKAENDKKAMEEKIEVQKKEMEAQKKEMEEKMEAQKKEMEKLKQEIEKIIDSRIETKNKANGTENTKVENKRKETKTEIEANKIEAENKGKEIKSKIETNEIEAEIEANKIEAENEGKKIEAKIETNETKEKIGEKEANGKKEKIQTNKKIEIKLKQKETKEAKEINDKIDSNGIKEKFQTKKNIEIKLKQNEIKEAKEINDKIDADGINEIKEEVDTNETKEAKEIKDFQSKYCAEMESNKKIYEDINSKEADIFSKFLNINEKYLGLYPKIIDKDNEIINSFDKIIGRRLFGKDKNEFLHFLDLLDKKIASKKFVKCYYESIKKILLGQKLKNVKPQQIKFFDVFSNSKISKIIYDILKMIVILECDEKLEDYFLQAVLYYVSKISKADNSCYNIFYIYQDMKNLKKTVSNFILSLNTEFHQELLCH